MVLSYLGRPEHARHVVGPHADLLSRRPALELAQHHGVLPVPREVVVVLVSLGAKEEVLHRGRQLSKHGWLGALGPGFRVSNPHDLDLLRGKPRRRKRDCTSHVTLPLFCVVR